MLSLWLIVASAVIAAIVRGLLRWCGYGRNLRRGWIVGGAVSAVVGLVLIIPQSARLDHHFQMRSWPVIDGTVISSEIVGEKEFKPAVEYRYLVDGQPITTTELLPVPGFGSKHRRHEVAAKTAAQYIPGRPVPVHYDPGNPAQSRLNIQAPFELYGKLGFGVLLLSFGLLMTMFYRRSTGSTG